MVEQDELDKLAEGMGKLDGPRAGRDEFDELLSLEAQWNEEGRKDGVRDGTKQGVHDGKILGIQKGHELGVELGYYAGCAEAWLAFHKESEAQAGGDDKEGGGHPKVESFPTDDIADERVSVVIDSIRGKWKAAISQMGMTLENHIDHQGIAF